MTGLIPPLLLLLVLTSTASAESVWLRGSGDDVWIEERAEKPEEKAKTPAGLTRVVTSPVPSVARKHAEKEERAKTGVVVLGDPHWAHHGHTYEHDFSPRYYIPGYASRYRRVYYPVPLYAGYPYPYDYPYYYGGYGYDYGYYGSSHHGGRHRFGRSHRGGYSGSDPGGRFINAPSTGGHELRGGAYRRTR